MGEISSDDWEAGCATLDAIREKIEPLRKHANGDFGRLHSDFSRPGSQFRQEQIRCKEEHADIPAWHDGAIFDVQELCAVAVLTTVGHVHSLARLLYVPIAMHSVHVVARTSIELAARTWWLLEEEISPQERVTRVVAEILGGLQQDAHFAAKFHDARVYRTAQNWADAASEWAKRLELPIKIDKKGKTIVAGAHRPTASDLLDRFLPNLGFGPGSAVYGYLSSAIHGQPYHLMRLGGKNLEAPVWTMSQLLPVLSLSVSSLMSVHGRYAAYMGSRSTARLRPYVNAIDEINSFSGSELPVGRL